MRLDDNSPGAANADDNGAAGSVADHGLRCAGCGYNLTGLTRPRCPECGVEFDWEQVRLDALDRPTIAFERAKGWRRGPAFVVTWATVLFAPWIFARQAVKRIRVRPALAFGGLCFIPVTIRYIQEGIDSAYFAWLSAAAIYILAQALLMIGLDPHGWRRPRATFLFWLAVGGYTSAIVVTEFMWAAPLMSAIDLWHEVRNQIVVSFDWLDLYDLMETQPRFFGWMQVFVWLAGLSCCYGARLKQRGIGGTRRLLAALVVFFLLFWLYAFCVNPVGYWLFEVYGGSLF